MGNAYQIALSTRSEPGGARTALSVERMDATVLAYRRQGFFVWEKLNGTHDCQPGVNSPSACHVASDVVGAELALTHVNASTHGVPFVKNQKAPNGNPLYGGVQVDEAVIGKGFGWELAWAARRRSTSSSRVPLTTSFSTVRVIPSAISPGVAVDFRFFRKDFTATSSPVDFTTAFVTVAKAPRAIGPSVV